MEGTRAERRRAAEERILQAAQKLFAENDYEKTTIRAIATAADVDPAIVIRYFGDKEALFRRAVHLPEADTAPNGATDLTELLTRSLGAKLGGLPPASLALLRSMFSHPEAAAQIREALNQEIDRLSSAAPESDAELRSGLAATMMLGIVIGRHLLDLPAVSDVSVNDIQHVMEPVLRVLMTQPDEGAALPDSDMSATE